MNIQMRIITDKNVNQLMSLIESETILHLTGYPNMKAYMNKDKKAWEHSEDSIITVKFIRRADKTIIWDATLIPFQKLNAFGYNDINDCKTSIDLIKNPTYPNVTTDIHYALSKYQMDQMIVEHFNKFHGLSVDYNKELILNDLLDSKLNIELFDSFTNHSKFKTLSYMFKHIRTGDFLSIKKGKVAYYVPFYNVDYKNTWHTNFDIEEIKNGLERMQINQNYGWQQIVYCICDGNQKKTNIYLTHS